jgi:hypothetical protein
MVKLVGSAFVTDRAPCCQGRVRGGVNVQRPVVCGSTPPVLVMVQPPSCTA